MRTFRRSATLVVLAVVSSLVPAVARTQPAVSVDEAVARTLRHVRAHAASFHVARADVAHLRVTDAYRSADSGVTHVYLTQQLNGLDVRGANLTAGVLRDGTVFHTGSRLLRGLEASGLLLLDASMAVAFAAAHVGAPADASDGGVAPRLVYEPVAGGVSRLAWDVSIQQLSKQHWWDVAIDAETGAILTVGDYVDNEGPDDASYNVFPLPLESPNDGPRALVTSPADVVASPYGWHDLNGAPGADTTTTLGNNVSAYADVTGTGLPLLPADGGPSRSFDYPLDLTDLPIQYKDAAITNLFYWNNITHDVFYGYGFDEAAGNFQENNYGRGGRGVDSVNAEGQDSAGVSNANFSTPPDGSHPRMQMYLWPVGRTLRDGDLDAGVVVHEYGHGISNRLTGGPSNVSCLNNAEQGGEGWSDFFAIAVTARAGDSGAQKRGMGTYVTGGSSRSAAGIRPAPYSTNMSFNNATYDRIKANPEVHYVGWVWATILWELYWRLVGTHGFNPDVTGDWTTGGNNLAIQLVVDGLKLQACDPGFVDSRNAILAADTALTGGANQCTIWGAFVRRGLGYSANQGSADDASDGTQAFDKPPSC
jgi:extracellular elastinolytic metalloproteinase